MAKGSSSRPAPSGTRDVLPGEMAELRRMTRAMIDRLDAAGYGEVRTPSVEYERAMPGSSLGPEPAYRLLDEHGDALVLRSDMTLPIARIATTRYERSDSPLRFSYLARTWRRVKPLSGESRELLQLGGELIGADPEVADAELLTILADVLGASGLSDWRIAVGHAALAGELLAHYRVSEEQRSAALGALDSGDIAALRAMFAGTEPFVGASDLADALTLRLWTDAAGPESGASRPFEAAYATDFTPSIVSLASTVASLPEQIRARVIIDFSLRPKLGYYDGLVFEVYDPAVGRALGGGGRYDRLMRELGREQAAIGFALDTELVHAAVAGEERGEEPG